MAVSSFIQPDPSAARQIRAFAWGGAGLVVCFAGVLARLGQFALKGEFNSYVLLVPVIAAGLVWARWKRNAEFSEPNRALALALLAAGILTFGFSWMGRTSYAGWPTSRLILATLSFVVLLTGFAAWFLGRRFFHTIAFPLGFLVCMVPLPPVAVAAIDRFLQFASAWVAAVFFQISGLPVFQRGELDFQLPGVTLEVAPECSGIQSSLALFIVSLAAGYVFLRSPWKRALLSLVVIPLGIARNAVRILTIGELCVHFGPEMIHSYLHRKGGWIFFLAALLPFLALLLFLVRLERPVPEKNRPIEGTP